MNRNIGAWALVVVAVISLAVLAQDKMGRLYVPYSKLTDLSDKQKSQIAAIEADYRGRIEKLEIEKHERIQVVLNDDQKAAIKKMADDDKAKAKERSKKYQEKKKTDKAAAKEGDKK